MREIFFDTKIPISEKAATLLVGFHETVKTDLKAVIQLNVL